MSDEDGTIDYLADELANAVLKMSKENDRLRKKLDDMRIERAAFEGRLAIAEKAILEHNQDMQSLCDWIVENRGCVAYRSRGRTCPDCPLDHQIDYQGVE